VRGEGETVNGEQRLSPRFSVRCSLFADYGRLTVMLVTLFAAAS